MYRIRNNYKLWVCGSGSPNTDESIVRSAQQVGFLLGHLDYKVIFGGGSNGVMGAVAKSMTHVGKRKNIEGVITRHLLPKEADSKAKFVDRITDDMFDRKKYMMGLSDAYLILPGGVGTMDELFEALTLQAINAETKPIIVYDSTNSGFIPAIKSMLKTMDKMKVLNSKKQFTKLSFITNLTKLSEVLIKLRNEG